MILPQHSLRYLVGALFVDGLMCEGAGVRQEEEEDLCRQARQDVGYVSRMLLGWAQWMGHFLPEESE